MLNLMMLFPGHKYEQHAKEKRKSCQPQTS